MLSRFFLIGFPGVKLFLPKNFKVRNWVFLEYSFFEFCPILVIKFCHNLEFLGFVAIITMSFCLFEFSSLVEICAYSLFCFEFLVLS